MQTVSAILITHKRPVYYVKRALKSIYCQTHSADEIIVVYTDTNLEKYLQLLEVCKGCRLICTMFPSTSALGRNIGALNANCKYLAFLDDDDEWCDKKLESQIRHITGQESIVFSPYKIESNGHLTIFNNLNLMENRKSILGENVIGCTSFPLISKKSFDEVGGFDESFDSNQEWDLWIRIVLNNGTVAHCNEFSGIKHNTENSISSNSNKRMSGWISFFCKYWQEVIKNPKEGSKALKYMWKEAAYSHKLFYTICSLVAYSAIYLLSRFTR